jgi:glycosyltransferase involved in cell wall biosynthesis
MNDNIVVSVVIPAYNSENYIRDCLDATVRQTYSNIEIIIIDDGSTDSTKEICEEYVLKDKRIKLFSNANSGVSAARNLGIDKACGQFIVFFDADDMPELDIIERYLSVMDEMQGKDISFVICGVYFDNLVNKNVSDKKAVLEPFNGYVEGKNYLLQRNYASTLAWLRLFNFVTNKIYALDRINSNKIRFDESIFVGEDLKFNLDYLTVQPGNIGMINEPLYHNIKRNEKSLSISYHESDIEDTKRIYRYFLKWEAEQENVEEDNILVLKSVFITDWVRRLSAMYDYFRSIGKMNMICTRMDREIRSKEFIDLLEQIHDAGKIGSLRYLALKTGKFSIFYFLRYLYQELKG